MMVVNTSDVATLFSFVNGLWGVLPAEITALIWFSLKAVILYSLLRMFVH